MAAHIPQCMKPILSIPRSGPAIVSLCLVLLACETQSNGSDTAEWTPARLVDVRGVPIDEIHRSIDSLLSGPPLASVDADTWRHARSLYRVNDGGPDLVASSSTDRRR